MRGADRRMGRLDQRRFAHAARAPQQRVVRGQAAGKALGVLDQQIAHPVDALEQRHLDPVDAAHGRKPAPLRVPDEGFGGGKIRRRLSRRRETFEGGRDPAEDFAAVAGRAPRWLAADGLLCCFVSGMSGRTGHIFTDLRLPLAGRGNSGKRRRIASRRCNWANGGYSPRRFRAPFFQTLRAAKWPPGGAMLITPAFAQGLPFGLSGDSSSMIVQFMPLILIIVIMYFLIL